MLMLDRIKKRQLDGFKEFVQNMEITALSKRQQIMTAGILEDPNFMSWVVKNLKAMDDVLNLPTDEMEKVLASQAQIMNIFAKAISDLPQDQITNVVNSNPRFAAQIKDELAYLKAVENAEREGARYYLVKSVRKLQEEEVINGFGWKLPPMDVFYPRTFEDGKVDIYFETGVLAATGEMIKNKRIGKWTHFYDTGTLLASGEYTEGLKTGEWEFFYANGKPRAKGLYFDDLRGGVWDEWDRAGKQKEVYYKDGAKVD
jgi:hypothetical protein